MERYLLLRLELSVSVKDCHMKAFLSIKKNNKLIIKQPARSFVIAFPALLARQFINDEDITIQSTEGTPRTEGISSCPFYCCSPGGFGYDVQMGNNGSYGDYQPVDYCGVVIGSDNTAVDPDNYSLNTQIRSGDTTGKILYCGTSVHSLTYEDVGDTGSFKILGIFKNISGASIDVKEVGVYATGNAANNTYINFCILRDVISTISLADGEYLEVEYTISIAS